MSVSTLFPFTYHLRLKYVSFSPVRSATRLTASPRLLLPSLSRPVPLRVQPPLACLPVHVAALPGCDVARRLRRGSRVRPAARRPPLSPGSEGRDMPAVATCPAATPTAAPAPPAAAAAPSPEALGTCGLVPQGGALAPRQARRGALPARRARAANCARGGLGAGGPR